MLLLLLLRRLLLLQIVRAGSHQSTTGCGCGCGALRPGPQLPVWWRRLQGRLGKERAVAVAVAGLLWVLG